MPEEQGTNHQLGLGWVDNTRASSPHRGAIVNCLSPRALTGWGPQPPSSSGADRQLGRGCSLPFLVQVPRGQTVPGTIPTPHPSSWFSAHFEGA